MTSTELRANVEASEHEPYFFDHKTMQFFGDRMSNYGVSGYVKGYEKMPVKTPHDRRLKEECIRHTCEVGKINRDNMPVSVWAVVKQGTQPSPDLLDVLYCLVSDSDVLDSPSYEEWGPELGYDVGSRKGEVVYRQCLTQSLAFKNLVGYAALETLRGLFQDY